MLCFARQFDDLDRIRIPAWPDRRVGTVQRAAAALADDAGTVDRVHELQCVDRDQADRAFVRLDVDEILDYILTECLPVTGFPTSPAIGVDVRRVKLPAIPYEVVAACAAVVAVVDEPAGSAIADPSAGCLEVPANCKFVFSSGVMPICCAIAAAISR